MVIKKYKDAVARGKDYQYVRYKGIKMTRYRANWIEHKGKIPKGMMIHHINGVKFVRWGMLSSGNIVTNDVTKKINSNEKSAYLTRKKEGIEKYCIDKMKKNKPLAITLTNVTKLIGFSLCLVILLIGTITLIQM